MWSRQEIEAYIRAKYVERRFVRKQDSQEHRSKVMMLTKHDKHLKGSVEFLPPRPPPPTPKIRPTSNTSGKFAFQLPHFLFLLFFMLCPKCQNI